MKDLHKKSTEKKGGESKKLTERRVREIAREETIKYLREEVNEEVRFSSSLEKRVCDIRKLLNQSLLNFKVF